MIGVWVLSGTIVTFDDDDRVLEGGSVWVDDGGRIVAVTEDGQSAPPGFDDARRTVVDGFVYPGLIDLHNHLPYNTISLWRDGERGEQPWADHNQWPRAKSYGPDVSGPGRFLGWVSGPSLLAYAEMKAMLGGTTSVQGNGKVNFTASGALARNIDGDRFGTSAPDYRVATLVAVKPAELDDHRRAMRDRDAGLIAHLCEGTDPKLREKEFDVAVEGGIVARRLALVHGTALDTARLRKLARAGAALVWSPFSNMWLYGATADVATAHQLGLRICLGSDWAPSGTKSILGELKVADLYNRAPARWTTTTSTTRPRANGRRVFTDLELCRLATANPGDTVAEVFGPQIGRLASGRFADLIVVAARKDDPYRNLIEATEADVELVVVGGEPRLGTPARMRAAGGRPNTTFTVAGAPRAALLRNPGAVEKQMSWRSVTARLNAVRRDPKAAARELAQALAAVGGNLDADAAPLVVIGDMPLPAGGDGTDELSVAGRNDPPEPCPIPALDSLVHDKDFFDRIDAHSVHRGLLTPLRAYWSR